MNTILWILLTMIGSVMAVLLVVLIFLGNPSQAEPRFLKALRMNMWSETMGMLGYGLLHPHLFAYRATRAEQKMPLPGDELVPGSNAGATYTITIRAGAEEIWPWLLQMGHNRAGWYSWSPAHAFPENKHQISTVTLHPEWQIMKAGDVLLDGDVLGNCSENRGAWRVKEVHEGRTLVFYSARDFIDGFEFDPQSTRPNKIYGITSWVFHIVPAGEKQSRLLIRVRAELGPGLLKLVARLVFGYGDAVFERTILEGIKSRVENISAVSDSTGNRQVFQPR